MARILIVDDDGETCRFMKELLDASGARDRRRAGPGESARAGTHVRLDLVISDINLNATLTGLDVLRAFKSANPGSAGPARSAASARSRRPSTPCATAPSTTSASRSTSAKSRPRSSGRWNRRRAATPRRAAAGARCRRRACVGRDAGDAHALQADCARRRHVVAGRSSSARAAPARSSSPARSTPTAGARERPFVADQLRRAPRDAARVGAVRPRARRVHRRRRRQQGHLRAGATAAPCSSTRSARRRRACRSSCCACSRRARSGPSAASRTLKVDDRVIAATNRDLETGGRGRRVPPGSLLPPERDRRSGCRRCASDARTSRCSSARFLAARAARAPIDRWRLLRPALTALAAYDWPGNVRELENTIERLVVFSRGNIIDVDDLPPTAAAAAAGPDDGRLSPICRRSTSSSGAT